MATTGISKPATSFTITPHKLSICILVQVYAPPSQISIPFPFSSVSQHNCLGIFLLSLTKACESIFEPTLDELTVQLKEIGGVLNHWSSDQLSRRLSSLASPDDLFNFFNNMRVSDNPGIVLEPLRQASEELQLLEYHELASEAFHLMAIVYDKLGCLMIGKKLHLHLRSIF